MVRLRAASLLLSLGILLLLLGSRIGAQQIDNTMVPFSSFIPTGPSAPADGDNSNYYNYNGNSNDNNNPPPPSDMLNGEAGPEDSDLEGKCTTCTKPFEAWKAETDNYEKKIIADNKNFYDGMQADFSGLYKNVAEQYRLQLEREKKYYDEYNAYLKEMAHNQFEARRKWVSNFVDAETLRLKGDDQRAADRLKQWKTFRETQEASQMKAWAADVTARKGAAEDFYQASLARNDQLRIMWLARIKSWYDAQEARIKAWRQAKEKYYQVVQTRVDTVYNDLEKRRKNYAELWRQHNVKVFDYWTQKLKAQKAYWVAILTSAENERVRALNYHFNRMKAMPAGMFHVYHTV